jgi:hypothetical protein
MAAAGPNYALFIAVALFLGPRPGGISARRNPNAGGKVYKRLRTIFVRYSIRIFNYMGRCVMASLTENKWFVPGIIVVLLALVAWFAFVPGPLPPNAIIVPKNSTAVIVPPNQTAVVVPKNVTVVVLPIVNITPVVPKVIFIGVTTIDPLDLEKYAGVRNNIVVSFTESMNPVTVTHSTFVVRGPSNETINGVLTSDSTNTVWTFSPTDNLLANSTYTVTITTAARGVSGNALVTDFVSTFTTTYADIITTFRIGSGPGPGTYTNIGATPVPPTPNGTAVLTRIGLSPVSTTLNYNGSTLQLTATALDQYGNASTDTISFSSSNTSVATVNSGSGLVTPVAPGMTNITATNANGSVTNRSAITVVTVGAQCTAVSAVNLGMAASFAILSEAGITESLPASGTIVGKIGTSPITGAAITGVTCAEVTASGGKVYEINAGYADQSCVVNDNTFAGLLNTGIRDSRTAYAAANALAPCVTELGAGDISGMTLAPGVYKWGTNVNINTDIYLAGNATSVWVFQMAKMFDVANTKQVHLSGGALAKNVFWVAAEGVHLGTTSIVNGNILSSGTGGHVDSDPIALFTGATLNGGAYSWKAVTLQGAHVTNPN